MNTIKDIEKSRTKINIEILTTSHQEYYSKAIFTDTSEMHVIAAFYLICTMFRKFTIKFDINLRISGRNKK